MSNSLKKMSNLNNKLSNNINNTINNATKSYNKVINKNESVSYVIIALLIVSNIFRAIVNSPHSTSCNLHKLSL